MDAPQSLDGVGADRVELLCRWILVVMVLGLLGTVTELVLLEHYEQPLQFVPLVLIGLALLALLWQALRRDTASLHVLLVVMVLFCIAGFAGVAAHFVGSAEFQL